jgi:hypothetical protein
MIRCACAIRAGRPAVPNAERCGIHEHAQQASTLF